MASRRRRSAWPRVHRKARHGGGADSATHLDDRRAASADFQAPWWAFRLDRWNTHDRGHAGPSLAGIPANPDVATTVSTPEIDRPLCGSADERLVRGHPGRSARSLAGQAPARRLVSKELVVGNGTAGAGDLD